MVPCPDSICNQSVPLNTLLKHFDKRAEINHDDGLFSLKWSWRSWPQDLKVTRGWDARICKKNCNLFFVKCAICNGLFYTWVYIAAGADVAENYQVSITIRRDTNVVKFKGKVFPIDVEEDNVFKDEKELLSIGGGLLNKLTVKEEHKRMVQIDYHILKV
jgi:hypothetical protein